MIKKSIAFHHHHSTCWVIFISSKLRENWRVRKSILLTSHLHHSHIIFIPVFLPNRGNLKIQNDEKYKFDQFHRIDLWLFFKNKFSEQFISTRNKEKYQTFVSIVWSSLKSVKIILKQKYGFTRCWKYWGSWSRIEKGWNFAHENCSRIYW